MENKAYEPVVIAIMVLIVALFWLWCIWNISIALGW